MMAMGWWVDTVTHNEAPASAAQDVVHLQQSFIFIRIAIPVNFTVIVFIVILSYSFLS